MENAIYKYSDLKMLFCNGYVFNFCVSVFSYLFMEGIQTKIIYNISGWYNCLNIIREKPLYLFICGCIKTKSIYRISGWYNCPDIMSWFTYYKNVRVVHLVFS